MLTRQTAATVKRWHQSGNPTAGNVRRMTVGQGRRKSVARSAVGAGRLARWKLAGGRSNATDLTLQQARGIYLYWPEVELTG